MPDNDKSPDWVKDAIFYQIFPDSFAKSEQVQKPSNLEPWHSRPTRCGFKGGDLIGICEHLDYLESLGINALYLTPIFQSTWNHRYGTTDFFHIDPILGGDLAFRKMLDMIKQRGFRVIIDGVFNHVGRGFYPFQHALDNLEGSPYLDWFYLKWFPLNSYTNELLLNYEAFYDRRGLPKLNIDNDIVKDFIFSVVEYWTRFGIDGWRIDAPNQIKNLDFWREFRKRVKNISPGAYLVGEIWDDACEWLQGDIFDATTNYPFLRACLSFFGQERIDNKLAEIVGGGYKVDAPSFDAEIHRLLSLNSENVCQMQLNHLDSHDSARFLSMCSEDIPSLKLAVLFQMTFPGAPNVYYGDEIGMSGGLDPDCRRTFPWYSTETWDFELLNHYKKCIELRKQYSALRDGKYLTVYAYDNCYAYIREKETQIILIVMNVEKKNREISIDLSDNILGGLDKKINPLIGTSQGVIIRNSHIEFNIPGQDAYIFLIE